MTHDIGLDALTALERDATPAPWEATALLTLDEFVVTGGPEAYAVGRCWTAADAVLIAAMRNTWPALLSALTATRAELERKKRDDAQDTTIDERDEYHEVADKLAEAIAAVAGVDIGEHSSENDPWANALEAMPKVAAELADAKREIHALTNSDDAQVVIAQGERDGARAEAAGLREYVKALHAELAEVTRELNAFMHARIQGDDMAARVTWLSDELVRVEAERDFWKSKRHPAAAPTAAPKPDEPKLTAACNTCSGLIRLVKDKPTDRWVHAEQPADGHDATWVRRCAAEPGCNGKPLPFDLACDRHPACAECGGRIMHELSCRTARAERLKAAGAGDGEQDTATTRDIPVYPCANVGRDIAHWAHVYEVGEAKVTCNGLLPHSVPLDAPASVQGAADGEAQA